MAVSPCGACLDAGPTLLWWFPATPLRCVGVQLQHKGAAGQPFFFSIDKLNEKLQRDRAATDGPCRKVGIVGIIKI